MINKTADNSLWQSNKCLLCYKVKYSGQLVFSLRKRPFFTTKVSSKETSAETLNLFHIYTHHSSHHEAPIFFSHVFWCLESPILKLKSSSFVTLYSPGHSNWLFSVWTGLCIFSSHMTPCCAEGLYLYLYLYLRSCMDRARRESNHSEWYINNVHTLLHKTLLCYRIRKRILAFVPHNSGTVNNKPPEKPITFIRTAEKMNNLHPVSSDFSMIYLPVSEVHVCLLLSYDFPKHHHTYDYENSNISTRMFTYFYNIKPGTAVAQWLRCCATNRKVAASIPAGVSGLFIDIKSFRSHYGPGVDSASNTNEYQDYFLGVKVAGA